MIERRMPVRETAKAIWRDMPRLIAAHPVLWAVSLGLSFMINLTDAHWAAKPSLVSGVGSPIVGLLIDVAMVVLPGVAIIPAALATHRTVILGVVESPAAILADRDRMLRYGLLEIALGAAIVALLWPAALAMRLSDASPGDGWTSTMAVALVFALIALCCYLILRAAVSFPAAAVGDSWSHVMDGWRVLGGRMLGVLGVVLLTPVGIFSAVWLATALYAGFSADTDAPPSDEKRPDLWSVALLVPGAYAWVITMSHIYRAVFDGARANPADPVG
jgi:hypothetical protein